MDNLLPIDGPEFPDAEKIMVDLLTPFFPAINVDADVGTVHPDSNANATYVANGGVLVQVRRISGQADRVDDESLVRVAVTASSRAESQRLIAKVRGALRGFSGIVPHEDGTKDLVRDVAESKGPLQLPEMMMDARRADIHFTLTTRLPR